MILDKTMENEEDIILNDEEIQNEGESFDEDPNEEQQELDLLRKQVKTLEAQKDHWRKKAQYGDKKPVPVKQQDDTEVDDFQKKIDDMALFKANIDSPEDLKTVYQYAKLEGISVSEALKSDVVKAIIEKRAEFKRTADVTNTSNAKRSVSKVSDEILLEKLNKGEIPDSKEEAERIFWARRGGKRS